MPNKFRKPKGRRFKTVEKLNLSEHTMNVNIRKCSYDKFRFSDIEDYVREITEGREYQFQAIKQTMIYLWGGGYKDVSELASENFNKKSHIRERFGTEEILLGGLPLADRLSGVVHMATGTGKSWVIFAVGYLSLVMGLTKRVLVLGPPSTIIEQGLREKFREFIDNKEWNNKLPKEYQNKIITLANDNDPIEDNTIVIENINAVFTFGSIQDTFFKDVDEVLVLSDEVHHAYSHLKFNATNKTLSLDKEVGREGVGEARDERLWMQFLLGVGRYSEGDYRTAEGKHKITRHIGFTGTPYNADDYFTDVIFDYNVRTAINEKYIKDINPIIRTETEEGEIQWTTFKKFEVVMNKHLENSKDFAYARNGKRQVKPITVFYCPTIVNANNRTEEFIQFLVKWDKEKNNATGTSAELEQIAREKVICVTGGNEVKDYKNKLDNIEEINPKKVGGKVEFIFSVSKLLEGWDVDNVFQIVPMEEKIFNSKLLISQVIGRGLRIPRKVSHVDIQSKYPMLTVTNHEKFATHIQELIHAVTNTDLYIVSEPLVQDNENENNRGNLHFSLFNLSYLSGSKVEDAPPEQQELPSRELILTKSSDVEDVNIIFEQGSKKYGLQKKKVSVDFVVDMLHRRFKAREYESVKFDFGEGEQQRCPTEEEIRKTILKAMEGAKIGSNELVEQNKKQIELYFNQFLPKGKKKRVFVNVTGDLVPVSTKNIERESLRVGQLEHDSSVFLSENYESEVDEKTKAVLRYLKEGRGGAKQQALSFSDPADLLGKHGEYVRSLVENDPRPPFIVNPSVLKSPQSSVLVAYYPEKEFVFRLLENSEYVNSWIKSPDKGFYSIDYEYWKDGKDRVRRGFNPDFFIKIDLEKYIGVLNRKGVDNLDKLKELQEQGIEQIIRVVEIKSDEDDDKATPAKAEWATKHFKELNIKLREVNPIDVEEGRREYLKQYYIFDLLKPREYFLWFDELNLGKIL